MRRLTRHLPWKRSPIRRADVEIGAPPEEVVAVEGVFARFGLPVEVNAEVPLSGGPPIEASWVVSVALVVPITAFFAKLGSAAAEDAYAALSGWVRSIREARKGTGGRGEITIYWEKAKASIVIPSDEEAIVALRDVNLSKLPAVHVRWHVERQVWQAWDDKEDDWRELVGSRRSPPGSQGEG